MENESISFKEQRIRKITHLYYSRQDVQKAIFDFAKNREICPTYFEGFGKRPDSFQYVGDVFELVKKGATSFNCSEELWQNPLDIQTGMAEEQANELRIGWDLLLDIDCKWIDYSKKAAQAIIKTLNQNGVENVGVKFSVSGDTPILIKDKEEINLILISEAVDLLKKGKKLEVLSLDKKRKLKFSKIYDCLKHKDILYEIKYTQSTIPLKVTGHHSVFVWDKGDIIQKKVTDLKKGDFMISFNSQDNPFINNNLEIINKFEFGKNQHSKKIVTKKIKVTNELMRLIGYFLAEGHVTNIINQVGFSFNKNEKEYIEDVKKLLSLITGRKISIRHPNSGSTQILIHSKEWATFFDNFCGKKKDKHIPSFAFKSSRELFLELLKGYIRGDGYKIGEYGIVVKSVSKRLITEMIWLCKLNNISCNLSWEQNKPHTLPQGTYFKGSLVYMLKIPKSEFEISEFHRKRNKFSPYAGDKIFPVDGLKEVYNQIRPKMFNYHRAEQMTLKKKRANLNRIRKVLKWFDGFNEIEHNSNSKKILNNYRKLSDSDISVVEIKDIIKKEDALVYDVSVEETESFFGNYYPILLHNSGSKGFHIIVPWNAFPKQIAGEPTKNLFPELPRIIASYIRYESEKQMKKSLPEDFYEQFKDVKIKKGIKCKKCSEIADKYDLIELYCDFCKQGEQKKINENIVQTNYSCPICKRDLEIKNSREVLECQKCRITSKENPNNFSQTIEIDLFELMGLDIVLVSPRHLFRMPYSLHEKTALSSMILFPEELNDFELKDANPMKVKIRNFMPDAKEDEAKELVMQALDWHKENQIKKNNFKEKITGKYADYKPIKLINISDNQFPPCINKILLGIADGKKRALFVLINLFRSIGMEKEKLEKKIEEWNKKNKPQLKQGYIQSQLSWSYRKKPIMPPNCKEFYQGVGVCMPDNFCQLIKNPVNYVIRKNKASLKPKKSKKNQITNFKNNN